MVIVPSAVSVQVRSPSFQRVTTLFASTLTSESFGEVASKIATYWNEDNLTWTLTADGTMTISGSGAMKAYDTDDSPAT